MIPTLVSPITIVRKVFAVLLLCIAATMAAPAQTFTLLSTFDYSDGATPYAELVQGFDGKYYGTTSVGGANQDGTVFEMTAQGKLTTLYSFCSLANCVDGNYPISGLVQAINGSFYGTAEFGGANNKGTAFELTSQGKLVTLYSFCSQTNCADGAYPSSGLTQATNGNFYGTTAQGGANDFGTVFSITPRGKLTTLYSFCSRTNCMDGEYSSSGVVQATNGDFYGTTYYGGVNGHGEVFEITPQGKLTTLYSFCAQTNCADGAYPSSGLVQATNGSFYGTTAGGGSNQCAAGCGTVFQINSKGKLTTLYSFCSQTNCADGTDPLSRLVHATNGSFQGTNNQGGTNNTGTIFSITPQGELTTLYSFCSQTNCADGAYPRSGLLQATNGNFYGTTSEGGVSQYGTFFSESLGLVPFVKTNPTSGKAGAEVIILGNKLSGTVHVSFHGTPAKFTVISATEIKTSVPGGATTGYVTVTAPKRKLKSNVFFRVMR